MTINVVSFALGALVILGSELVAIIVAAVAQNIGHTKGPMPRG